MICRGETRGGVVETLSKGLGTGQNRREGEDIGISLTITTYRRIHSLSPGDPCILDHSFIPIMDWQLYIRFNSPPL